MNPAPRTLRLCLVLLPFLQFLIDPSVLRADQSVTITKINGVAIPPDQVSVPISTNQFFEIEWAAIDTDCNRGVRTMSVLVDGVAQVSSAGSGFSGFVQLDQNNFPTQNCLHTIEIQALFSNLAFCSLPGSTITSAPAQMWSTDYRTCTGPADCNKGTVGRPIDVATGRMYHEMTDLRIQGPLPIIFVRRYDSQATYNGPQGFGWQHNYSMRLESAGTNREVLVDARARRIYFVKNSQGAWDENRIEHLTLTQQGTPAWRVTDKNQTKFEFDSSGNLTKIVDRNNNTLSLGYIGANLTSITDAFARSVTLTYYGTVPDRIHTISGGGRTVTYTYDGNGNLQRVDYPDTSFVTYDYTDPGDIHNMTAAHDALGHLIESHVYVADRVTHSEADGGNGALDITYDSATQTTVTNSRGVPTVYTYSSFSGLVTASAGPGCASCGGGGESTSLTYDSFLNLMERVNGRGIHTQMTYDGKGNMLTRREAVGTSVERLWRFTYNPTFNFLETIKIATIGTCGAPDKVVTNTYNGAGDLTQQQITGCNGPNPLNPVTTIYTYDSHGQIKTVDGPRSVVPNDLTTYDYFPDADPESNRRGRLMTVTNALGQQTNYTGYDQFGNVGSVTDANNAETTYLYDGRDRVTETRVHGSVPAEDIVTINQYDLAGNLDFTRLPNCVDAGVSCAFSINYGYDNVNRLTEMQDAVGNKTIYTYDTEGNRTRDEFQDSLAIVQAFANFAYDSFDRLQYIYFNGIVPETPGSIFSKFTYDGNGNRQTDRDPEGHVTSFTLDELDRLATVTQTAGLDTLITTYGYDRLDGAANVRAPNSTGPGSFETTYQNSDMGWRLTTTSPDTGMTSYTYDPAGNLMSSLDAKGITVNHTHDALNRPLVTSYPDSSLNITQSYDSPAVSFGIGRRTGMTDQSGASVYQYDRRGLLRVEGRTVAGTTYTTQYGFDKNGNRTQILYPTSDPLQRQGRADFTYDAADRVTTVTTKINGATTTVASNILYKPFGPRTHIEFGNGLIDNRAYDSRYQIGTWTLGGLLSYTHTHNNDANLTSRTDNLNAANDRAFSYDGAHRLTQASGPWGNGTACTGAVTYSYDKNGNRLCKGESASATSYTYTGGTNRLSSSSGPEVASYSYDLNGNATADGAHTYQYNDADRLATVDAGATASYRYDGEGHRVIKLAAGATTYFFYDTEGALLTEVILDDASGKDYLYLSQAPLARVDWSLEQSVGDVLRSSGSTPNVHLDWSLFPPGSNTYVVRRKTFNVFSQKTFAGNAILATVQDPVQSLDDPVLSDANNYLYRVFRRGLVESLNFYHADHLNTPIAMTGASATFVRRVELFPFGGVQSQSVSVTQDNLRFPGQYFDTETAFHYNVLRDYLPRPGRYTQPDPAGFLGSMNLYLYVGSNPLSFIDPDGLRALITCIRCAGAGGPLRCSTDEDGKPGLSFNTNEGVNEGSSTLGDPFGTSGPIPPGLYDLPNAFSPKFKRILPSPTNTGAPGRVRTPAGTVRTGIRIHAGRLSQGCLTTGPGQPGIDTERAIVDLVRRNTVSGGTSMTIQEEDCNAACNTCPPK
jgi:RHS repeat-associated protein